MELEAGDSPKNQAAHEAGECDGLCAICYDEAAKVMSKREQILSECAPQRISSRGSNPWAIVHRPTGEHIDGPPQQFDFGDHRGVCPIMGQRYFARKRDAQAALDALKAIRHG